MRRIAIGLAVSCAATFVASAFAQDTVAPETPIRIAIGPITPPLFYVDPDGQMRGFVPDLLREAAARAKLDLEFEVVPDETSLRALNPADVPLVAWLRSKAAPTGYLPVNRAYLKLSYTAFRREALPPHRRLRTSLLGEIIVLDGSEAQLDLRDSGASLFTAPTIEEAFQGLERGDHDSVVLDQFVGEQALKSMKRPSIITVPALDLQSTHTFKFLRSQDQPGLEASLVPALDSMRRDGSYDALYDRWLTPLEPTFIPVREFKFAIAAAVAIILALLLTAFVFRGRLVRAIRHKDSQLYESVSRLDEIVGSVEAVVWEATPDGLFTYVSPYAEQLFGYTLDQWKQPEFWETVLLHPEDREEAVRVCSTAVARGEDHRLEYRARRSHGEIVWIDDVVKVVKDAVGKSIKLRGILMDITKRKQAEETVQSERARLAAIMEVSPTGIFRLDLEGRVTFGNQEALRITGFDSGLIDLRRWLDAVHPDDRAAVASAWKALVGTEGTDEREFRFVHPDGKIVWVLDRGVPEHDASGRVTGFVGTLTDITQLKRAEETVNIHSQVLMSMTEGVGFTDKAGKILYTNAACDTMYGYMPGELRGQHVSILSNRPHEQTARRTDEIMTALRETGRWDGELRSRRKDGSAMDVSAHMSRVDGAGEAFAVSVQEDITLAKRTQEALRQSETMLRRTEQLARVGGWEINFETNVGRWSDEVYRIHEVPDDYQPTVESGLAFLKPEDQLTLRAASERCAADGTPWQFEGELTTAKGRKIWVRTTGEPVWKDEKIVGLVGAVQDITSLRTVEQALRENEALFRAITEQMPDALLLVDFGGKERGGRVLYANSAAARMHGRSIEEIVGRPASELDATPSPQRLHDIVTRLRAGEMLHYESEHRRKDGSVFPVEVAARTIEAFGTTVILAIDRDITERKRAEAALRGSEQHLRAIVDSEPECIKLLDEHAALLDMNPAGLAMIEAESIDKVRGLDTLQLLTPEYRDQFQQDLRQVFQGKTVLSEFEILGLKGTRRWMEQHAVPLWDVERPSCVKHMLAVTRDVTARKQAEAALRQSEARLALIFNSTSDLQILFRVEDSGRYIVEAANRAYTDYVRRAFPRISLDLVGRERAEYLASLGFSGEDIATERPMFRRAAEHRDTVSYTIPFAVNGAEVSFEVSVEPILDPEGRCTHLLWDARDVTARRRAEEALDENRRALRVLMSNLPGMAYRCRNDRDWTLEFANEGCLPLTGFSVDELVTRAVVTYGADIVHPEDQEAVWAAVQAGLNGKRPFEIVYRIRTKSAEQKWVWEQGRGIYSPTGELLALEGFIVDITTRIHAEEASRLSQERLKEAQHLAKVGSWELDLTTNHLDWSGEIYRIFEIDKSRFGASYDAFLGLIHPEDRDAVDRAYSESVATKNPYEIIHRLLLPDGRIKWVHERSNTFYNANGDPLRSVGTVQDITERKIAEEEHRAIELQMQHAQKLESLGVLAGGIAHDFNNLLAGILGNADLALMDAPVGGPIHESVSQIALAGHRAADLVNQMLAYSGRGNFVVRSIRLGELVREMAKLLQAALSKKAVLRYELDDTAPPIEADPAQIQQVVMNLITNASDALGENPGVITLRSGVEHCTHDDLRAYAPNDPSEPGQYVFLEVTDTGCGMDQATLDHIFDPFFTTKFTGRGLGLAATLGIVRGHHGGLRIDSRVGHGTTFRIIFPVGSPAPVETNGVPPVATAHGRAATLLVVDDEQRVRDFLVRALQLFGHEVLSAENGRQALEVFDRNAEKIDAVLLDLTMPEMSGEEVLRELHARRPGLPVVLMSGYSDSETHGDLAHNGHAGFLRKPFTLDALRDMIGGLFVAK